jgi:hypothetical protein
MARFFAVDWLQTELAAVIADSGPVLLGPEARQHTWCKRAA